MSDPIRSGSCQKCGSTSAGLFVEIDDAGHVEYLALGILLGGLVYRRLEALLDDDEICLGNIRDISGSRLQVVWFNSWRRQIPNLGVLSGNTFPDVRQRVEGRDDLDLPARLVSGGTAASQGRQRHDKSSCESGGASHVHEGSFTESENHCQEHYVRAAVQSGTEGVPNVSYQMPSPLGTVGAGRSARRGQLMTEAHTEPTGRDSGPNPSRRGFLAATGGGAAAVAAVSMIGAAEGAEATIPMNSKLHVGNGPFVIYVESAKSGKIIVFSGTKATKFKSKALVRKLVRKAGE